MTNIANIIDSSLTGGVVFPEIPVELGCLKQYLILCLLPPLIDYKSVKGEFDVIICKNASFQSVSVLLSIVAVILRY